MPVTLHYHLGASRIDSLVLDAMLSASHQGSREVTKHPVEKGFAVTDHARVQPYTVTIEGMISNTPLSRAQTQRQVESRGVAFSTTQANRDVYGQAGYVEEAYHKLRALLESETLIEIDTGLRTYENMIMTALNVPQDASAGDALMFTATFEQIRIVENKTTTITVAAEPKAKKKIDTGKATAKGADEATKKKAVEKSDAASLWDAVR